jgi:hypothetical protein
VGPAETLEKAITPCANGVPPTYGAIGRAVEAGALALSAHVRAMGTGGPLCSPNRASVRWRATQALTALRFGGGSSVGRFTRPSASI